MKKIDVGQGLTILANLGVIVGIILLVYELNQAREFARFEFITNNRAVFQATEREMIDPEVASIWAKATIDPSSLTPGEIRVMDAFLINLFNFWAQNWRLERDGYLDPGSTETDLRADVPFYFGSTFTRVWWDSLKSTHTRPEVLELDNVIDEILNDASPSENREWLDRIQRRVQEALATSGN